MKQREHGETTENIFWEETVSGARNRKRTNSMSFYDSSLRRTRQQRTIIVLIKFSFIVAYDEVQISLVHVEYQLWFGRLESIVFLRAQFFF